MDKTWEYRVLRNSRLDVDKFHIAMVLHLGSVPFGYIGSYVIIHESVEDLRSSISGITDVDDAFSKPILVESELDAEIRENWEKQEQGLPFE